MMVRRAVTKVMKDPIPELAVCKQLSTTKSQRLCTKPTDFNSLSKQSEEVRAIGMWTYYSGANSGPPHQRCTGLNAADVSFQVSRIPA
jgi:hypothetical protein